VYTGFEKSLISKAYWNRVIEDHKLASSLRWGANLYCLLGRSISEDPLPGKDCSVAPWRWKFNLTNQLYWISETSIHSQVAIAEHFRVYTMVYICGAKHLDNSDVPAFSQPGADKVCRQLTLRRHSRVLVGIGRSYRKGPGWTWHPNPRVSHTRDHFYEWLKLNPRAL